MSIQVYSVASGKLVRTAAIKPGTGRYVWIWNGWTAGGKLLKAGRYRIVQTLVDAGSNQLVSTAFATLSMKKLAWRTVSTTLRGSAYSLYLDTGNGYVSRARSSYAGGVKIASGSGAAGVQYRFRILKGTVYKTLHFSVLGRRVAKRAQGLRHDLEAELGPYDEVGSFDAIKPVGPGYRWWATSVPHPADQGRLRSSRRHR